MVKTNGVSKDYFVGKEVVHALKNANIECNNGSVTLFMGPSGSGKSTALKVHFAFGVGHRCVCERPLGTGKRPPQIEGF